MSRPQAPEICAGLSESRWSLATPEVHRSQLGQPRRRAVLATAAADAAEPLGLVANADLLELDARAEQRRELAHEVPEVDALLGREVDRELAPVPLPLGVRQLHDEVVRLHALHGASSRDLVLLPQLLVPLHVFVRREPARALLCTVGPGCVRHTRHALLRELARRMDAPEILTAVCVDDHRRPHRRRLLAFPEEELLSIAFEGDFDQMIHVIAQPKLRLTASWSLVARAGRWLFPG